MSIVDSKIEALNAEKQELVAYVKEATAKIKIPPSAIEVTAIPLPKHTAASAICVVGGLSALALGLCLEKNGISTVGGVVTACGAGLWMMERNKPSFREQREVKYYQITSCYLKSCSDIFKTVEEKWNGFLIGCKKELKADIMQLDIPESKKNEAIQSILTTSVISMSMAEISSRLNVVEKAEDANGYARVAKTFQVDCIAAIGKAYDEQLGVYENLLKIL